VTIPTDDEQERICAALGWRPEAWRATAHRGPAANSVHWVVTDGASRTAFVKLARATLVATWLRQEHRNLVALHDRPFAPRVLGWFDDGDQPVLALEDLSAGSWPPPWTAQRVADVVDTLGVISAIEPPAHLSRIARDPQEGWPAVEREPGRFLRLGLCSPAWLDAALPRLVAAAERAPLAGDSLIHFDVRSDNVCFHGGRALFVDWNHATVANPKLDLAFWLPSLQAEGGPQPDELLPGAPELAAWVAGFFCSQAGLPAIPDAPHVRPLQLAQARTALPWAARALGLPPPG
jgi:hypothetical protein